MQNRIAGKEVKGKPQEKINQEEKDDPAVDRNERKDLKNEKRKESQE